MTDTITQARITADQTVPIIRIERDFAASPAQVLRAHLDPELFVRWVGPNYLATRIDYWDASRGGRFRFTQTHEGQDFAFYGSFHEITDGKIVQTFTWEGEPDGVALETIWFEDLGNGHTRLRSQSLCDSFEARDAWLASGMETGVNDGYAKLDGLLATGAV